MFVSLKAFVFYGGSACGVLREFIASLLADAGERGSPGKQKIRAGNLQQKFFGCSPRGSGAPSGGSADTSPGGGGGYLYVGQTNTGRRREEYLNEMFYAEVLCAGI